MKKHWLTLLGFALASSIYFSSIFLELDLFEKFVKFLSELEHIEVDELIIPFMVFLAFLIFDLIKMNQLAKTESEKHKIYQAMMSSMLHVVNNFLNQMQYFKMTADDTPGFNPELLSLYDTVLKKTLEQIDSLKNIKKITETAIKKSVEPMTSN